MFGAERYLLLQRARSPRRTPLQLAARVVGCSSKRRVLRWAIQRLWRMHGAMRTTRASALICGERTAGRRAATSQTRNLPPPPPSTGLPCRGIVLRRHPAARAVRTGEWRRSCARAHVALCIGFTQFPSPTPPPHAPPRPPCRARSRRAGRSTARSALRGRRPQRRGRRAARRVLRATPVQMWRRRPGRVTQGGSARGGPRRVPRAPWGRTLPPSAGRAARAPLAIPAPMQPSCPCSAPRGATRWAALHRATRAPPGTSAQLRTRRRHRVHRARTQRGLRRTAPRARQDTGALHAATLLRPLARRRCPARTTTLASPRSP